MHYFKDFSLAIILGTVDDNQLTLTLDTDEAAKLVDPATSGPYKAWIFEAAKGTPAFDTDREQVTITDITGDVVTVTRDDPKAHDDPQKVYLLLHGPGAEFLNSIVVRTYYLRLHLENGVDTEKRKIGFGEYTVDFTDGVYTITATGQFDAEMYGICNVNVLMNERIDADTWKIEPVNAADELIITIYKEE